MYSQKYQPKLPEGVLGGGDSSRVIVFGCGGHARSIINALYEISERISVVLVDQSAGEDETILGCRVESKYRLKENENYIIAVGDNTKRKELYCRLVNKHVGNCISIISRDCHIGMEVKMGRGTFVAANVYIGPQAEIGYDSIINTGSVVEHEVVVGNHTHIAPNSTICGRVRIGDNVFCGAGSTIKDKISVCNDVVIGAGSVVVRDIEIPGVYVGVPVKRIGNRK